jgi:broad specificity phosphatase PhoE
MLDLWLIRHAESLGNLDGTGSDTPLSERGEAQARALAHALATAVFDEVHTSPLVRAVRTAQLALPARATTVDARLTELASGPPAQFVDGSDPAAVAALLASSTPPPAESGRDFMARVSAWRETLPARGSAAVFSHFAVIREILAAYVGFSRVPQSIEFTGLFRLQISGATANTVLWNDISHLRR